MKFLVIFALFADLMISGCSKKNSSKTSEASLIDLNRALSVVNMRSGRGTPDTNEVMALLAASGKAFPKAPTGKKIVLDTSAGKYVIIDQ